MLDFGIEVSAFYNYFFEKNIYFKRNAVAPDLVDWNRMNDILYGIDPSGIGMKLFLNGVVPCSLYSSQYQDIDITKARINSAKFAAYLHSGATLVISRVDEKDRIFGALCLAIAQFTGLKTVANGYVAFGGSGTFGRHWDTHDVCVVQIKGKKRWQVFSPTFALPLEFQTSRNFKNDCPDHPIFDEVLNAGDLLYIPRGWWHHAIPIPNQETFHISAGMHTAKLVDYLDWLAKEIIPSFQLSRVSLTADVEYKDIVTEFAGLLAQVIQDPANLTVFLNEMKKLGNIHQPVDLAERAPS